MRRRNASVWMRTTRGRERRRDNAPGDGTVVIGAPTRLLGTGWMTRSPPLLPLCTARLGASAPRTKRPRPRLAWQARAGGPSRLTGFRQQTTHRTWLALTAGDPH